MSYNNERYVNVKEADRLSKAGGSDGIITHATRATCKYRHANVKGAGGGGTQADRSSRLWLASRLTPELVVSPSVVPLATLPQLAAHVLSVRFLLFRCRRCRPCSFFTTRRSFFRSGVVRRQTRGPEVAEEGHPERQGHRLLPHAHGQVRVWLLLFSLLTVPLLLR